MKNRNGMLRREFLKTSSLFLSGITLSSMVFPRKSKTGNNKPHIIYIITDQNRRDCLGCTGNEVIKTPNITFIDEQVVVLLMH